MMCIYCFHMYSCFFFTLIFTEKYFDMNKKQCKDALEIYKRFLVRMDKVSEFLKTAEVRTVSGLGSV